MGSRAIAFEIGTSKFPEKLLKEKRGLGDCPQGFDFGFSFHAQGERLSLPFFAFFAKKGKHNAMLKVLKHGIMRGIFRRRREKYHAKARACAFFPLKEKAREKCFG
ncbi:MAG: hypothetical protein HQL75_10315, partial [Magnetococcales bacterium]|nr:hypothetical protein [Magnetococcales bacterium]